MSFFKRPIVIAIAAAAVVVAIGLGGYLSGNKTPSAAKPKPYQAVFLTNGQVYFGKIVKTTTNDTYLNDIYYLQVQQPLQPPDPNKKDSQQPQLQLVKLGNELHKPKDEMVIKNLQILFTEEIQNDGQVGQAIDKNKKGETTPAQQ